MSPNSLLIDIHCHRLTAADHRQIVSLDTHEFTGGDYKGELDAASAKRYFSLGIHPWFIADQNIDTAMQTLASARDNPNLLAVGECGLDKCINTAMELQIAVFTRQIELAERIGKPLIIHCVKAFNELLQLKKQTSSSQPWIIHGFTGNPELARQLLRHGCYLSFGKALFIKDSQAARSMKITPLDRLFLETDAATDVEIGAIHAVAAKILELDIPTLQRQIVANFDRVFAHD